MRHLTHTHSYAELVVSAAAYEEIASKLKAAGYLQAFGPDGTIDMQGIGLVNASKPEELKGEDAWQNALPAHHRS